MNLISKILVVLTFLAVLAHALSCVLEIVPLNQVYELENIDEIQSHLVARIIPQLVALIGIGALLPMLLSKVPISVIPFPNKKHWFSEERNAETIAFIQTIMRFLAIATTLLLLWFARMFFFARFADSPVNKTMAGAAVAVYILLVAGLVVWTRTKFRKVQVENDDPNLS